MKKRKNSKKKGAVGELELAHLLTDLGLQARRSQQFSGTDGTADIIFAEDMHNETIHVECKRCQQLDLEKALMQAIRDCQNGKHDLAYPVVMHRRNNEVWKATMHLVDWIDLYKTRFEK